MDETQPSNLEYLFRGSEELNARFGEAVGKLLDIWDEQCHTADPDLDDD